jgi:hypothetical protein
MGAEPSRLELVVFVGFPSVGCRPPFACSAFSSAWLTAPVVSTWPAGPGHEHWGGMGNEFAGWSKGGLCAVAREAQNGVDSRSGILANSERAGRKSVSAPKPNLEGDVLLLDPKTKFLSLTGLRASVCGG